MNGIKFARLRCCAGCPHRIDVAPPEKGPNGYPRFCTAPDGDPVELHDDYMEGPDSNCLAGHWAERISVSAVGHAERQCWRFEDAATQDCGPAEDPDAFGRWNTRQNRDHRRREHKPGLKSAVQAIADDANIDADITTALAVLTAAGAVPGWMADEIRNELGNTT